MIFTKLIGKTKASYTIFNRKLLIVLSLGFSIRNKTTKNLVEQLPINKKSDFAATA